MPNYLSRRGGRFFARLRIPGSLQAAYGGKLDLRASFDTADPREARQRVLESVLRQKRDFARLQAMLDARQLVAGSALLLRDGLLSLESAARECRLSVATMLKQARNRAVELRVDATGRLGVETAVSGLDFEPDAALVLTSALDSPTESQRESLTPTRHSRRTPWLDRPRLPGMTLSRRC